MSTRTVKVSNVSPSASEQHIEGYFSISGDIEYVEMRSGDACSQIAYVTFKDSQGAEDALLLSDAKIDGQSVVITAATDYELPPTASTPRESAGGSRSSVLGKGFRKSKKAVKKAIAFGMEHRPKLTFGTQVPICGQSFSVGVENSSNGIAALEMAAIVIL